MLSLDQNIQYLKGVGEKRAQLFYKLGVQTVRDLLHYYPRDYEDWSHPLTVGSAPLNELCCVRAKLLFPAAEHRVRKGMTLYKCQFSDGKDMLQVTLFNNGYLAGSLTPGQEYLLYGRVGGGFNYKEMATPRIEPFQSGMGIHPVYRQTDKLTTRVIAGCVRQALALSSSLCDPLSQTQKERYGLCSIKEALENIHFPESQSALQEARKRLVFEELLFLQLGLQVLKYRSRTSTQIQMKRDFTKEFQSLLPFTLTRAQKRAIAECAADLAGDEPMSRLIQGDVGSGKTAVAAALVYQAAKNGWQSALMAPTEILAVQHFESLSPMLGQAGISVALLTGSTPAAHKRKIKEELKAGRLSLVVGTHALLQKDVAFQSLGLVVTDEQHRFGVEQRRTLSQKGDHPHLLVMSATPIPRTLALMIYGDLDMSILDELPPGRQPIDTFCVKTSYHPRIYTFLKKHLDQGRQAYVVCPLVEEGETELIPAESYAAELSAGAFRGYRVGLLHGKMKPKEKDAVMGAFSRNEIQLLVSTTVVEVGVNVPNAVVMLIENAERFGLSQLHQLRGRVGRGKEKSFCILVTDAQNDEAVERMKVMCSTTDGFKIADEDLRLRGPGDFFGNRQHGLPDLKLASITDMSTLKLAQKAAVQILKEDPGLLTEKNHLLRESVEHLFAQADGILN